MTPSFCRSSSRSPCASTHSRLLAFALCALALVACRAPWAQPVAETKESSAPRATTDASSFTQRLREAMARRDSAAIDALVAEAREALGARAGEPEVADRFLPIPRAARPLSAEEAAAAVAPALDRLETLRWWRIGLDPTQLAHPLREPAAVAVAALAMRDASPRQAERASALATDAGEFLLWAQREAGRGVFPFPASRGISDAPPFRASQRFLEQAEREGRLSDVVVNGWVIDDRGDGGLQFDNGECGVAMLALHRATGDARYLAAARRAADWASAQPLSSNWNYNAFSVYLLAETHRVTGEARYREAAWEKARYGVIPGQLREGRNAGRWVDPHNARPAYHFIILRGLASLAVALPVAGAERSAVERALRLGLAARNRDVFGPGAANIDDALQALAAIESAARDDPAMADIFKHTRSAEALAALRALGAEAVRRGRSPFGPLGFGVLLTGASASARANAAAPANEPAEPLR